MKKYLILSVAILSLIANSCKQNEANTAFPQDLTIQEAKEYYENNTVVAATGKNAGVTVSGNKNKGIKNFKKNMRWNVAMEKKFNGKTAVVVPFQYDDNVRIKTENGKIVPIDNMISMVMYKDNNNALHSEIVKKIPDDPGSSRDKPFQGLIIVEDLNGNFIRGYNISKGKVFKLSYSGEENGAKTSMLLTITVCRKVGYSVCPYSLAACGTWGYDTYCTYTETEVGDGWAGEPSGGGQTGSDFSTGTPGSSDYSTFYNLQDAEVAFRNDITTNNLSPCVKSILSNIQSLSSNGNIQGIVYKFSSSIPGWKWELKTATTPMGDKTVAATDPVYSRRTGVVTTTFNPTYLSTASDLSIAKTVMHEAVHAYLAAYFGNDPIGAQRTFAQMVNEHQLSGDTGQAHHNEFVRIFLTHLGDAMKEYGEAMSYDLPNQFYYDLVWGGLTDTPAFGEFSPAVQLRIKNVINIELVGKDVDQNPQPKKGSASGC